MRVLIVEDNEHAASPIVKAFRLANHETVVATTFKEAVRLLNEQEFDVVTIDLGLPDGHGLDLCVKLRKEGRSMVIMMITGTVDEEVKVECFKAGANDYIVKPPKVKEMVARAHAHHRRSPPERERRVTVHDIVIDIKLKQIFRSGKAILIQPKMYLFLERLAREPGSWVPKRNVMDYIYGEFYDNEHAMDVLASRTYDLFPRVVESQRGRGYRLLLD